MLNSILDAEQGISIGILTPSELFDEVSRILKSFPSFVPLYGIYRQEEEMASLIHKIIQQRVELLFFTDQAAYQISKQAARLSVPAYYVPATGSGLYRALFRMNQLHHASTLSIDGISHGTLERIGRELGMSGAKFTLFPGTSQASEEEMAAFHRIQVESGQCDAVITGSRKVAGVLRKAGVPHEWVAPTEQDMIVYLERVLLATETRRSKEAQIVFGLVQIDHFKKLIEEQPTEHDVQRLKLDIQRSIVGYVESLEGHLSPLGGKDYLFITTRGAFERETGGYKYMRLAAEMKDLFDITLSIGIGFGHSAHEAGAHARSALWHANDAGGNMAYIVREDKSLLGPMEMAEPLACDLALIDRELIARAEKHGLTPVYLSKLIKRVTQSGLTDFNAQELAATLGVSVRSAHRFLVGWVDTGMVEIVGEERKSRGRPKQIFRLSFLRQLIR